MKVKNESEVAQSCPTLSDHRDGSPPGSSIHGIFQARVLEWGAIAFSKKSAALHVITHLRTGIYWSFAYMQYIQVSKLILCLLDEMISITDLMDMNLSKLWGTVEDRGDWNIAVHGVLKSQKWLCDWTTTNKRQHENCFQAFGISKFSLQRIDINTWQNSLIEANHTLTQWSPYFLYFKFERKQMDRIWN